jgi:CSLREA domain-containing protein
MGSDVTRLLAIIAAAAIPLLGATTLARAGTTINVTTTADAVADTGSCSLREAITAANTDTPSGVSIGECPAGAGTDTVLVPPGTYSLSNCELTPASDMTIAGTGPPATILDGAATCRVFAISSGTVSLSDLTIRNGSAATGGGISNAGTLTVTSSTILGSSASGQGGAIWSSGTLTMTNSTLASNAAGVQGGGIFNAGTASLSFSAVSGSAAPSGGSVYTDTGASTMLTGTLLANSTSGGDCAGDAIGSGGHNLVESPGACFTGGVTDLTGVDPKLNALAKNGGATQTFRPITGSPVLDAAGSTCPAVDQRANSRFQGQACDIGPVELTCTLVGTNGPDYFEPLGGGVDIICGLGGNDRLKGGTGNDVLIGGPGNDALHSFTGDDLLIGGPGDDPLRPGPGNNILDGGPGTDTIEYGNILTGVTVDLKLGTASGGPMNDTLASMENVDATDYDDLILGTSGKNGLDGKKGNDTLTGRGGDDTLIGDIGDDTLNGGDGDETLIPGPGTNVAHGDAGTDQVTYSNLGAGVTLDLGAGTVTGGATDSLTSVEKATGTNLDDSLTGDGSNNVLTGLGGSDFLFGLGGVDTLNAGDGDDTLDGGALNDSLRPGLGSNTVEGGLGIDTVDYSGLTGGGVTVDLGAGTTTGVVTDTLSGVENANGTAQADSLTGSLAANVLNALMGADTLNAVDGISGNDYINGGVDADADVCSADPGDRIVNCP